MAYCQFQRMGGFMMIKKFLKRYWHDIPFFALAVRAVLLTTTIAGLITIAYFLAVVVPIEVKHYKIELNKIQQYKIKKGLA